MMIYLSKREMSKEEIAALTEDELYERSVRYLKERDEARRFRKYWMDEVGATAAEVAFPGAAELADMAEERAEVARRRREFGQRVRRSLVRGFAWGLGLFALSVLIARMVFG